ncbi:MAG: hypothetical protein IJ799_07335 [Bacteroidales bacterium]|nr:hypothetical protein [Bacteroidales bacterium]
MKKTYLKPPVPAYESPLAEIEPLYPERMLCLSGQSETEDFDVIDYSW